MKKLLCLLLCRLMLLACLAGCKKDGEGDQSDSGADSTASVTDEISVADLANYSVIYPENASSEVEKAAKDLANAINEKYSTKITVKNDYYVDMENSRYTIGEYEILVGETNREESASLVDKLLFKDHGYALIGKKLAIMGNNDADTVKAVEAFIAAYVTSAASDAAVFFSASDNTVTKGDYLHGSIKVGGVDLAEYSIVYPADGGFEKALATKLAYSLAEACGVFPAIVADSEAYGNGYEILIGKTNRSADVSALTGAADGAGYVASSGKFIVLAGNTSWGNATAVNSFIDSYESKEKSDSLDLTLANATVAAGAGDLTSMSFNIGGDADDARMEAIVNIIVNALPDSAGLQEVSEAALTALKTALGGYYEFVSVGETAVIFAKDKFVKSSASASDAACAWAIIERKSDSLKVMQVSVKFDETSATKRQEQSGMLLDLIAANKSVAVMISGDLACATGASEFKLLISDDMANASFLAADVVDNGGGDVVDYILAHDYYIDVVSYLRDTSVIWGAEASDRCPITVVYKVNYNGTEVKEETSDSLIIGRDDQGDEFGYPSVIY